MKKAVIIFMILVFLFYIPGACLFAGTEKPGKYWFFLRDKGPGEEQLRLNKAATLLTPRALTRRAKVFSQAALCDSTDLPVYNGYIHTLRQAGIEPVTTSRWLNAVSAEATPQQVAQIQKLPFVTRITRVKQGRRRPAPVDHALIKNNSSGSNYSLNYGLSLAQNELSGIPAVHNMGYLGQGTLIAVLDDGFHLGRRAFHNLAVLNQYDFINKDHNVDNEPDQDIIIQNQHGTSVLSILAAYDPGNCIGPAFGAEYLLAKTEDERSETAVEEDYWIAAAEWADSLGADIISSSLGYINWYTVADMDGETAPVTVAADMAVAKGIVVVVAAGNEGSNSWQIIGAPADGRQVISVGAVNQFGDIARFSSRGPTADGRLKPEVVAMGSGNYAATVNDGVYHGVSGTSAACPLVAGIVAQMLCAHPGLTPAQVREALFHSADRFETPDFSYGYGLVNAVDAVNYWGVTVNPNTAGQFVACYPNPLRLANQSRLKIDFYLAAEKRVIIEIYNLLGQKIATVCDEIRPAGYRQHIFWDGSTVTGKAPASGIYFCKITIGSHEQIKKITLLQ